MLKEMLWFIKSKKSICFNSKARYTLKDTISNFLERSEKIKDFAIGPAKQDEFSKIDFNENKIKFFRSII